MVPPAAGAAPVEQVGVGAGEGRRAQGGDDGDLVGRVLDGGEDGEQVAHGVGAPHQRAALDPVRDVGVVEGPLERADRRAGGHEDGDVVVAHRAAAAGHRAGASSATVVARRPQRGDGERDLRGLAHAHDGGPVGGLAAEEEHGVARRRGCVRWADRAA